MVPAKSVGFSIRYKFLAVTTLLLVFCVSAYLFMATTVFRKDKTELVFDFNRSLVANIGSDLETMFQSAEDKMRLVAYFFNSHDDKSLEIVRSLLSASQDIVYVGGSEQFQKIDKQFFLHQPFLETYALPEHFYTDELPSQKPVPFLRLQKEGGAIWNASIKDGPPLIGYAKSVVLESATGGPVRHYAIVAFLRADRILKAIERSQFNRVFVTNKAGELLAHPDPGVLALGDDASVKPLFEAASGADVKTSVLRYSDAGLDYLGAFTKSFGSQLIVFSRVAGAEAFRVVDQFVYRSLLVALMVLNLAFIAAILFSRSLTRPLDVLLGGMRRVAEGQLSTQIEVTSRDEIASLARSFNHMIVDLKQSREELEEINRDLEGKVKDRTAQLEKQNQAVKSAQEALLRTTRLAAVGEIAGRAAHEVLNPMTGILTRLQLLRERVDEHRGSELEVLGQMTKSWRSDLQSGGLGQLMTSWKSQSSVLPNANLLEEDLHNLEELEKILSADFTHLADDAEFLLRESQRIVRIIQSMRSLSVVQAEKRLLDLGQLSEEAVNIMRDLASQHNISVEVIGRRANMSVWADGDEFIQALTNLLRNAIQAICERAARTPGFKGQIDLRLEEDAEHWRIDVADNGVGISPTDQNRLFESQFSTKPRNEGTGLGLNISRRFIRAVGGDISLRQSQPDQGSVFSLILPKAKLQQGDKVA